ncbi:hypothetical protein BAGA_09795, partial [Bacillus gaemokensis]
ALPRRVNHQLRHLVHAGGVDQRPHHEFFLHALVDADPRHLVGHHGDEAVMDGLVHVDAVGRDADLARVAQLGRDQLGGGRFDIGIVEHDEGRVAAQFQRHFLQVVAAGRRQPLAHGGRARERELADARIAGEALADLLGIAGHHLEDAGRDAGLARVVEHSVGRQRRQLGRLDDHGAAGRQRGGDLAGDHHEREIPGRDGRGRAGGLLEHQDFGMRG